MDIEYVLTQIAALYLKFLAVYVAYKFAKAGSVPSPSNSLSMWDKIAHYFLATAAVAGIAFYSAYVMKTAFGSFGYSTGGIVFGVLAVAAYFGVNEGHKSPPAYKNLGRADSTACDDPNIS